MKINTMTLVAANKFEFKNEIQGLRVISIFLVALYHVGCLGVSGGVDLFICISGYFLGIHYLKIIYREQKYSAIQHVGSIVVRLLLPTYLFLAFFVIAFRIINGQVLTSDVINSIVSSLAYLKNFQLINFAYEYASRDNGIDPLVHLWAVSIIGQLSIISVFIFKAATIYSSRGGVVDRKRAIHFLLVVSLFLASISLAYSICSPSKVREALYFDTFARAYEFLFGIFFSALRISYDIKRNWLLTLFALLAFILFGPLFGNGFVYPGWVSFIPVLAGGVLL